jgi:hypothetical protein
MQENTFDAPPCTCEAEIKIGMHREITGKRQANSTAYEGNSLNNLYNVNGNYLCQASRVWVSTSLNGTLEIGSVSAIYIGVLDVSHPYIHAQK